MKFIVCFLMLAALPAQADQPAGWPLAIPEVLPELRPESTVGAGSPAVILTPSEESDFRAAQAAFQAADAEKLARHAKRLEKSLLEIYVTYYRLRLNLEKSDPKAIRSFLSRPEDTPLIDRLRGEWLKLLGKQQQWDLFDAEYPRLLNEDAELACYALQSRTRSEQQAALREARELWFIGKEQPESCLALFETALMAGIISEQDVQRRLRLALEAGNVSLAQNLAGRLGDEYEGLAGALKSAAADPDRFLENLREQMTEAQRIAAMFALLRLAKQSRDLVVARWSRISSFFPASEQQYFHGWLGYEAARGLDARALQWFRLAGNTPLDERQATWRVRAALRAQDWPAVLESIGALSAQQQREPAWLYWKARALRELGQPDEARNLFVLLSGEIHFYGQLAAEELPESPGNGEKHPAFRPERSAIEAMMALPGVQRTIALYRMGFYGDALEEWRWVVRNFNDRELLTAAEIARRNQMYDRAIGAAERTVNVHDFSLRYLAPYRDALHAYVHEHGLEEAWVYGLMRQESRFAASARSSAGAAGLMQIMPATARWAAERLGMKSYRNTLIHQLDTNLRLGTYYMKTVLSQFGGNAVLASAAYNAGPRRAHEWRGDNALEGAIYAETIPFEETRDYVKKVMSNTVYYARQFNEPPLLLKQRMGTVAPRPAADSQSDRR